jgi:hypothetical protein
VRSAFRSRSILLRGSFDSSTTASNFGHRGPENTFAFDTYTIYVLVAKRGLCERRHGVVMSGVIVDDEWHVDRAGGRTPIASNISPYVHPFDNVGMRY